MAWGEHHCGAAGGSAGGERGKRWAPWTRASGDCGGLGACLRGWTSVYPSSSQSRLRGGSPRASARAARHLLTPGTVLKPIDTG